MTTSTFNLAALNPTWAAELDARAAQMEAAQVEAAAIIQNDIARDRLEAVLHDVMMSFETELCINALSSGLDIVISIQSGTFIAAFARKGEARLYAGKMKHSCAVIEADNCDKISHFPLAHTTRV